MPKLGGTRFHTATLRAIIAGFLVIVGLFGFAGRASAGATVVPTAANDEYSVVHNQTLNVAAPGVLSNDVLPPGWEISVLSGPSNGVLTLGTDGSVQYVPFTGFVGDDSFVYQMSFVAPAQSSSVDTSGAQVGPAGQNPQATVTIHVTNSPPVPGNDNYATDQDTPLSVPTPGVLSNDSDPDGDPIEITGVADDVDNGTLVLNIATGGFDYTPDPGFVGVDTFVYTITDVISGLTKQSAGDGTTTQGLAGIPATVTITVTGVDTPTPEPTVPDGTPILPEPEPTATSAPADGVTDLPDTGTGFDSGDSSKFSIALLLVLMFMSLIAVGRARLKLRR